ncbi:glycerate kinase [Geomonas limicola]|uniref:Glycerate kinase n=1 Tax=Geomonas limicola TaxID=2740186 RepID=A0A6V8N8L6_9BACT|nr:glycerate kinase [Geomonas limicola]GFO68915.1 glycerate kinase [Geomonas limicola]
MNIVIAPDSFKESLSAPDAAQVLAEGFREVFPEARFHLVPLADGGEGTAEALAAATGGRLVPARVRGPLGDPVEARFALLGDGSSAVVEMAAASGLTLVPPARRNPLETTSYGTGELIRAALDAGARRLLVGIGGSATNDGGAGMLQALGVALLDAAGHPIPPGGAGLELLARIDTRGLDPRLAQCSIEAACDVDNPLVGPRGASAVFGPQKGATPEMVARLDAALGHFAAIIERDLGQAVAGVPGAGAAGGMGAALLAFLGATLRPGIEIVLDAVGLEALLEDADLVVTGEGRCDGQTASGKAPLGVARLAKKFGTPVLLIAGSLEPEAAQLRHQGIDALFAAVSHPCHLAEALEQAAANLRLAASNAAAALRVGMKLGSRPR